MITEFFSYDQCTNSDIWKQSRSAFVGKKKMDIHTRLMKKYKAVPTWWFLVILAFTISATVFACEYYESLQLPWWGVLLACAIAFIFTLPIGIIVATTNQVIMIN